MRGRLPVFAHPCQRIGAAEARWAHNPKVLRSKLRFAILSLLSRLAQLVERKTLNLVVVGSSPTVGVLFAVFLAPIFFSLLRKLHSWRAKSPRDQLLWRSWQRVGLIIPRSPVRSWSGAYKCLYSSVWQSMRLVSARSRVRSSLEAFSPRWCSW